MLSQSAVPNTDLSLLIMGILTIIYLVNTKDGVGISVTFLSVWRTSNQRLVDSICGVKLDDVFFPLAYRHCLLYLSLAPSKA